jgi:hypothetical protein
MIRAYPTIRIENAFDQLRKRSGGAGENLHRAAESLICSRATKHDFASHHRILVRFLHPLNGYSTSDCAQPGIAVDRFAREIVAF